MLPFDLHVLSIPPAFNLSQDQTLQFNSFQPTTPKGFQLAACAAKAIERIVLSQAKQFITSLLRAKLQTAN